MRISPRHTLRIHFYRLTAPRLIHCDRWELDGSSLTYWFNGIGYWTDDVRKVESNHSSYGWDALRV